MPSAQGRLPAVVNNTGITITKANSNFVLAAGFISPDHSLSQAFISNYLDVYVRDALKRVPGVGDVIIFGERKYAMRIWLDPSKLAARGLTALDVINALAEQNVDGRGRSTRSAANRFQARTTRWLSAWLAVSAIPNSSTSIVIKNNPATGASFC